MDVSKYSTIVIDQNRYSVPDYLVGEVVRMKVLIAILSNVLSLRKIATHCRKQGIRSGVYNSIYVGTLKKKPGALATSSALQQASPKLKQIYHFTIPLTRKNL